MTTAERLNAMPLGEAMFTQRAIRRFKKDPIPDDVLEDIMPGDDTRPQRREHAAVAVHRRQGRREAPQAGRAVPRSLVGPSGPTRASWGPRTCRRAGTACSQRGGWPTRSATRPVMVLICATAKGAQAAGSVIPSAQNMLLAARAFGIGGTITTLHPVVEERVHALFGIPDDAQVVYCMPLGYPRGAFGSVQRKPLTEVCGVDSWGNSYPE